MRYEIKYVIPIVDRYMIHQVVLGHPASFIKAFPDRIIHNIYYDSPDLQSFYQNINGDSNRQKIRFRWYNDHAISSGQLEIKKKISHLGFKEYKKIDFSIKEELDQKIAQITGLQIDPTLINKYKRSYFISMDGKFRLTIDRDIVYNDVYKNKNIAFENNSIVEIKFDKKDYPYFDAISKFIPFRQSKYSKYVTGITSLHNDN